MVDETPEVLGIDNLLSEINPDGSITPGGGRRTSSRKRKQPLNVNDTDDEGNDFVFVEPKPKKRKFNNNISNLGNVEKPDGRNYGRFEDEPLDGVPFGYVGKIIKWVDEEPSVPLEWIRNAILPRFLKDDDRETALYGGNELADENPVPYLRSMHIPRNHLANTYFKKRHSMGFLSLAWDLGVIAISTSISTGDDISKFLSSPGTEALGWGFYKSKGQELQNRGYTILENFGDPNNFHDGQLDMK